jgi:hypothetical protein
LLLSWGVDRADRDGLEAYLEASPRGSGVYKKFGWEARDQITVLDGNYTELLMLRSPEVKS